MPHDDAPLEPDEVYDPAEPGLRRSVRDAARVVRRARSGARRVFGVLDTACSHGREGASEL